MSTRILPAVLALPLLAACVPAPEPQPTVIPVVMTPPPAVQVAAPTPVSTAPIVAAPNPTPSDRPFSTADLGAPPPADGAVLASASPAPAAPASADGRLGTTVASLGSPTETGLWLKTGLVTTAQTGRISYNGKTVTVQLIPSGGEPGAGSQISIEAMRALGAPLTGLPSLVVYGA